MTVPSLMPVQFQIEDGVRRGDVAYQITRPVCYFGGRTSRRRSAALRGVRLSSFVQRRLS